MSTKLTNVFSLSLSVSLSS